MPHETGIDFRNDLVETQHNNIMTYEYSYNGGGVAAGDINHDGLVDLFFTGNSTLNKLYINKGKFQFEDITLASGTAGRDDWTTGVTMVDINGDGWLDIYVCYSGNAPGEGYNLPVIKDHPKRANQLFINNGCEPGDIPKFTERAKEYGLDAVGTFSTQAYFFDYDRDGDLDMFLLNHANMFYSAFFNTKRLRNLRHPYFGNKLYRNDGHENFVEVSEQAGLHGSGLNFGLSAAISDLNHDGWPDIYITNDYEEQDFCYINNRDGTFKEVSHTIFGHLSKFGMGSDIADINNDGLQDIIVLDMLPEDNHRQKLLKGPDEYDRYKLAVDSGYHHQYMRNTLQLNRGLAPDSLPRFSEIGQLAGISNTDWSWAPLVADFDNDGLNDIFVGNGYLRDYNNLDFIKYTGNVYEQAKTTNSSVDYLKLIQQLPSTELSNYAFRNMSGIEFTNVTEDWGLSSKMVSSGAVYADLDNDGDYDLIANNLNDYATVFRNNGERKGQNKYIKIQLIAPPPNTYAIGAKLWVKTTDKEIFREMYPTRGYLSSVDPSLIVGIGLADQIKEIKVQWQDGAQSVLTDITPNQTIVIEYPEVPSAPLRTGMSPNVTLLNEVTLSSGIDFRHQENDFVDFKSQRLLHFQLSRLGGKLAKGDVNNDANDDVFFGGASGQAGTLYLGNDDGTFRQGEGRPWDEDASCEDLGSLFFDADGDGDLDLYVVSGGSEFPLGDSRYEDRLYINDGNGAFKKANVSLPTGTTSGSVIVATDFDRDGDIDLFVGGRHTPSHYGIIPRSFILRNDTEGGTIKFTDVTADVNAELSNPGMVTAAIWTDFNNDSWPDLIVLGEWMPVRIFENQHGKLVERSDFKALQNSNGWWSSIFAADIDGDSDTDYFLGNAGTNLQFKASSEEPIQLYVGDLNGDGIDDPVLCHYVQGGSYPFASRDELLDQVATLRKKFISYASYADATIRDISDPVQIRKLHILNATRLESCWLENKGGADFQMHVLPTPAQFSSINGFVFDDVTGDGTSELVCAGNFFPFKPQLGRSDSSTGLVFQYQDGNLSAGLLSSVWLTGDIRDINLFRFRSGVKRIIVSRNSDGASVYSFR